MTKKKRAVPGIRPYDGPAGGWGSTESDGHRGKNADGDL